MNFLEYLKERFRPELSINQGILEREKEFNELNPLRENWVLDHIYLCEGDLKTLKQHPDYNDFGIDYVLAYYGAPEGKKGPCKRVVVSVSLNPNEKATTESLEKKLKLDLHNRGCNAGVFYRRYQRGNTFYAEAIPAILTGE